MFFNRFDPRIKECVLPGSEFQLYYHIKIQLKSSKNSKNGNEIPRRNESCSDNVVIIRCEHFSNYFYMLEGDEY